MHGESYKAYRYSVAYREMEMHTNHKIWTGVFWTQKPCFLILISHNYVHDVATVVMYVVLQMPNVVAE